MTRQRTRELSSRMREVLRSVALGHTMAETGAALGISEGTAKEYRYQALVRLDVASTIDAFRAVGWLQVPDA